MVFDGRGSGGVRESDNRYVYFAVTSVEADGRGLNLGPVRPNQGTQMHKIFN